MLWIGRLQIYVSTSALLSKWCTLLSLPEVILVTFGSEDQMMRVAPAATAASATAFPWAISLVAEAFSQSDVWSVKKTHEQEAVDLRFE
jgi:hypothetical protein